LLNTFYQRLKTVLNDLPETLNYVQYADIPFIRGRINEVQV